ncbi:hypothetical protein MTO96_008618 [Rhipicephalus appendiculatus]
MIDEEKATGLPAMPTKKVVELAGLSVASFDESVIHSTSAAVHGAGQNECGTHGLDVGALAGDGLQKSPILLEGLFGRDLRHIAGADMQNDGGCCAGNDV